LMVLAGSAACPVQFVFEPWRHSPSS